MILWDVFPGWRSVLAHGHHSLTPGYYLSPRRGFGLASREIPALRPLRSLRQIQPCPSCMVQSATKDLAVFIRGKNFFRYTTCH